MTTFLQNLRISKLAAVCAVAIGTLLLAQVDEAKAQFGYSTSQRYSWSNGSSWGFGPNGYYSNGYNNSSFQRSFNGYSPWGAYGGSQGAYRSNSWGNGFNPGSGSWGYRNGFGGGYNNLFRYGW
jgi:hypothetical protein